MRFRLVALLLVFSVLLLTIPTRHVLFMQTAEAATSDLFFSEYIEGTSNNKSLEIYNGTGAAVNLATNNYVVQVYSNGAATPNTTTALTGTVASGDVYVISNTSANATILAQTDQTSGNINYNGNDAVVLRKGGTSGTILDVIGQIGNDPGAEWGTGLTSTADNTLQRKSTICAGDTNGTDAFNPATEWNGFATDTFTGLGTHTANCGVVNNPPAINAPANPAATVQQDSAPFTVNLTGSDDNNVFNWSATPGTGISSAVVSAGQGTSSVTYTVTLQSGFSGTAIFTASLSDNVNAPVTRPVNIQVNPLVANNAPVIDAPANPVVTVAQDAAPFNVGLTGSDDNNVFNWSATAGTGISNVAVTAGQGTSSVTYTVTLTPGFSGTATFNARLSDNVNPVVTQPVNITVTPAPPPPLDHIVISQVYGGGGNSGAAYQNDFVELFNPTTGPIDLGGWSIQYGAATGTTWQVQPLGGTMQPGEYYLIKLATNGAVGAAVPAGNVEGSLNLSGTNGKVALSNAGDAFNGCPNGDAALVDLVGYGTTANCREGATNAPTLSNATAALRKNNGFTDTNINGNDFVAGTPNPRRTTPITELPPSVLSSDPRNNGTNAPRDATITVNFTEPVNVDAGWFNINCVTTGAHNSATVASGGPNSWLIIPNVNFQAGEQCTVTVVKEFVHDVDTDDATPANDQLSNNYSATFTVATGTAPPYPAEVHLTMGNPSNAVADHDNSPNNYLMEKPEFSMSYSRDNGRPNWVSWHLSDEWFGTLARVDTFRADPAVPADWYRVTHVDYSGSGFDRGHMTPNADRDPETSVPINQATFLMSNMIPQAPDNNQGPWANMENALRSIAGSTNELYIVAGGAGSGGTGSNGPAMTIAGGHVAVPASTWKVVLVLPKGVDDVSRVTCATRTIAVIMPNVQGIRNVNWEDYIVSVDAVETLTGYDFFSNLPDPVERCVEAGINGNNPALDTDADGVPDATDNCVFDANADQTDTDHDGAGNACDADDDNDGVSDAAEIAAGSDPLNAASTPEVCDGVDNDLNDGIDEGFANTDGDSQADCVDTDDDNDGVSDAAEIAAGSDPLNANSTPEVCDGLDNDLNDGVDEGFVNTDGDAQANCVDNDDDNDGVSDSAEIAAGSDPLNANSTPEVCDGVDNDLNDGIDEGFTNTDGDGQADCVDTDDDNDGVSDAAEIAAGSDPLNAASTPEVCDGVDNDLNDGIDEGFANTDGDSQADCVDTDDDNDGVSDTAEIAAGSDPLNAASTPEVCDGVDNDLNDGVDEGFVNTDGDAQANCVDTDDDGDGVPDTVEVAAGSDPLNANSTPEVCDGVDNDLNDGVDEGFVNSDGDAQANCVDADDDNDGTPDAQDAFPLDPTESVDTDHDGVGNNADMDDDNDGVADAQDAFPLDPTESADNDHDGIGNNADMDDDNDGVVDVADNCPLTFNPNQADFDHDGVGDTCDPVTGPATTKEQCQNGGWQRFTAPRTFKNQGDCIQFVNTGK